MGWPPGPQGECKCSTTLPQFGLSLIRGATKLKPIDVTDQHAGRCPVKPKGKIQTKGDSKHEATTSELHDHNGVICTVQCGATVQYYHNKTGNITNSLQKEKLLPTDTESSLAWTQLQTSLFQSSPPTNHEWVLNGMA